LFSVDLKVQSDISHTLDSLSTISPSISDMTPAFDKKSICLSIVS